MVQVQYIDKSTVAAEIERSIKINKGCMLGLRNLDYYQGKVDALSDINSFINTLGEVQEESVSKDLEKEIKLYRMRNPIIGHREESLYNYMSNVAKYFFGLGLKVNKGE